MVNRFFFIILFSLITYLSQGQQVNISDSTSRWRFGFNLGGAWQQSDIKADVGSGVGLTLERSFTRNSRHAIGFSLRGRYLYAQTKGEDWKKSTGIFNNPALNGTYYSNLDYTSRGFIYQNYETKINEFTLEAMLIANRLRAKKGFLFYVFGGIGATNYSARMDHLDSTGVMYDYSNIIGSDKANIQAQLSSMKDGVYESKAESNGSRTVLAPSLGLGIGFRISRTVTWGFEHKVTFPFTNLLDGNQWTDKNTISNGNDIYHYASTYFRFNLFGGKATTTSSSSYNSIKVKPSITILSPTGTNNHSPDCNVEILARIENVESVDFINVKANGVSLSPSTYLYNQYTKELRINTSINNATTFSITAQNNYTSAYAYVSFTCTVKKEVIPDIPRPVIVITNPTQNPYTTTLCKADVAATVYNVESKSALEVKLNGSNLPASSFNFDPVSKLLTLNVSVTGTSQLIITAKNSSGTATESLTLVCPIKETTLPKPIISVNSPTANPFTSEDCKANVNAYVYNIRGKEDIKIIKDGIVFNPGLYSFNTYTKILSFSSSFTNNSTFVITATNNSGSESVQLSFQCITAPVIPKPIIELTFPNQKPYIVTDCNVDIRARIYNIDNIYGISFYHNGILIASTAYSYDIVTKEFIAKMPVQPSSNFEIKASNSAGTESIVIPVSCQPKVALPKPVIVVQSPSTNPFISTDCKAEILAHVYNVESKRNIEIRIGNTILDPNSYTYDGISKELKLSRIFKGSSTYIISASNSSGRESVQLSFICKPVVPIPTVTITSPSGNPFISKDCIASITAVINNIDGKDNIEVTMNGKTISKELLIYNPTNKMLMIKTTINEISLFNITAKNESGKASANITIKCEPKVIDPVVYKPQITITHPLQNPFITTVCQTEIKATILHIDNKANLEIRVNGSILSGTAYSFDPNAHTLIIPTTVNGSQAVTITAVNTAGKAAQTLNLQCKVEQQEEEMITICHIPPGNEANPQQITIPKSALKAHLAHGDNIGPCQEKVKEEVVEEMITICHIPPGNEGNPQQITIPKSALKAHLAHGDNIGPCQEKVKEEVVEEMITICHIPPGNEGNPQQITIPKSALKAHLAHGDYIGPCQEKVKEEVVEEMISICHIPPGNEGNPQQITIPKSALKAHLAHGDNIGPCQEKVKEEVVEEMISICHIPPGNEGNPQQITIPKSALKAHLAHGDNIGPCQEKVKEEVIEEMITICHIPPGNEGNPQQITIPKSALKAHLAHGDNIGPCQEKVKEEVIEEMITICHIPPGNEGNPQQITIPKSALKAHLAHGDNIGPCQTNVKENKPKDENPKENESEENKPENNLNQNNNSPKQDQNNESNKNQQGQNNNNGTRNNSQGQNTNKSQYDNRSKENLNSQPRNNNQPQQRSRY